VRACRPHGHHDAARHRRFRAGLRRASSRRRSRRRRSDLQLRFYTRTRDHLGGLALARRARAHHARKRLRWALSLDEVGRDRPFWLRSPAPAVRPGVEGALLRAARRAHVPVSWVRDESTGNSDHREFELLGLPAMKLGVGAGGEPCRHTACDRPERLDPTSLRLARRLVEAALQSTAR
jgi:hypothetical protein